MRTVVKTIAYLTLQSSQHNICKYTSYISNMYQLKDKNVMVTQDEEDEEDEEHKLIIYFFYQLKSYTYKCLELQATDIILCLQQCFQEYLLLQYDYRMFLVFSSSYVTSLMFLIRVENPSTIKDVCTIFECESRFMCYSMG